MAQGEAHAVARSITDLQPRARDLAEVAGALVRAGQDQQAEAVTRLITNPYSQALALAEVAEALARSGHYQRATTSPAPSPTRTGKRTPGHEGRGASPGR